MGILGGIVGVALGWAIGQVINLGTNVYLKRQSFPPEHFWSVPWWLVALRSAVFFLCESRFRPISRWTRGPARSRAGACATSKLKIDGSPPSELFSYSRFSLVSHSAHAQSRIDCNALSSQILKHPVHYCVYLPAGYDAGAKQHPAQLILYSIFCMAWATTSKLCFNSGGWTLLDDLRRQHKMGEFLIVASGRRTNVLHQFRRRLRALQRFLSAGISFPSSKRNIASARAGQSQRSAESPWAVMVRCVSRSHILKCFRRSARKAPL